MHIELVKTLQVYIQNNKMDKKLKIATGCTYSLPGDVDGNLKRIETLAKIASHNGCGYMLTPEMSASGYGGYDDVINVAEIAGSGKIFDGLCKIAFENKIILSAGFAEKNLKKTHISQYTIFPNGKFNVSRKHRVTPNEFPLCPSVKLYYDNTEEIGHVREGDENFVVIDLNGVKAVIIICADFGIKSLFSKLYNLGVELLLLPTGAGGRQDERYNLSDLKKASNTSLRGKYLADMKHIAPDNIVFDCMDYNMAFACCNLVGFDGKKLYHGGSSKIIGRNGEILSTVAGSLILGEIRQSIGFAEVEF